MCRYVELLSHLIVLKKQNLPIFSRNLSKDLSIRPTALPLLRINSYDKVVSVQNLLPLHFRGGRVGVRCKSFEVKTRPEYFCLDTWFH